MQFSDLDLMAAVTWNILCADYNSSMFQTEWHVQEQVTIITEIYFFWMYDLRKSLKFGCK